MKTIIRTIALLFCAAVSTMASGQPAHWTTDARAYEYDMTVYATLSLRGERVGDLQAYDVAAFVGGECRGVATVQQNPDGSQCLYVRVRSNSQNGEAVTFRCYNRTTAREYALADTMAFEGMAVTGYPSSPHELAIVLPRYAVTVTVNGEGTVSGARTVTEGDTVSLTATPATGWHFARWQDGTADSTIAFTALADTAVMALFERNRHRVTFILDGETFAEDSVAYGLPVTPATVEPGEGRTFSGWEGLPDTMPDHDVTVYGNTIVTAIDGIEKSSLPPSVYTIGGVAVKPSAADNPMRGLPAGVYVIKGKKFVVR